MIQIYGDSISGNCLKVKWTADFLGVPYRWIETSVLRAETRRNHPHMRAWVELALGAAPRAT